MKDYEINDALGCLGYSERNSWEQSRLETLVFAQANSRKKLTATDIIKFPWDNEEGEEKDIEISNEDVKRLREKANQISKTIIKK